MLHEQVWLSAAMLVCTLRLLAFVLAYELNGVHSSPDPLRVTLNSNPNPNSVSGP